MNYTIEEIKNWLKTNLDYERYEHSIGTAECAMELAEKFCPNNVNKAYLAGLVHDCAKCLPKEKMLKILEIIPLEDGEIDSPKTHHAPVGSYIAKNEFNIDDSDILSAVRWHTIGKINMSDFEKIIFLADKMEEKTRTDEMRLPIIKALNKTNNLNEALLTCYKATIKSLVDRDLRICKQTIDIYNSLL